VVTCAGGRRNWLAASDFFYVARLMSVCLQQITVNGASVLALDPNATDLTTCQYVVKSGSELGSELPAMSANDGAIYSMAIIAVWTIGWSFRTLIKTLKVNSNEDND
jgi:hypothetical protein